MNDNFFMDAGVCPDEEAVQAALGDTFAWYEAVCDAGDDFEQEWKHYGRKYGWKLKVHDYVKTLFELTVADGSFRLGMAVRERELQAMRDDPELAASLGDLLSAGKSSEGWGIRLTIDSADQAARAVLLVKTVISLR